MLEISYSPAVRRRSLAKSDKQGTAEHPVFCEGRSALRRQDGAKNGEVSHSTAVRRRSLAKSDKQGTAEHPVFCQGRPAPRRQDGAKGREEIKTFEPCDIRLRSPRAIQLDDTRRNHRGARSNVL
ncbi:hypothetical protein B0H13DRAFT_1906656 [Mycena leptocephala]|nr:hypothetical protein B0H13DRAFT_1906656 [Mycena leptocephala]